MSRITAALLATLAVLAGVLTLAPAAQAVEDVPTDPCEVLYCPPPAEDCTIDDPAKPPPCDLARQLSIWERFALGYLTVQIYQARSTSDQLRDDVALEQFKQAETQADLVTWQQATFERNQRVTVLERKVAHKRATIKQLHERLRKLRH